MLVYNYIEDERWIIRIFIDEIVNAKMEQNEKKYPVSKAKGKADKYNKL